MSNLRQLGLALGLLGGVMVGLDPETNRWRSFYGGDDAEPAEGRVGLGLDIGSCDERLMARIEEHRSRLMLRPLETRHNGVIHFAVMA